jgi:hypothetical protein
MANTIIQVKRSTTTAQPTGGSLAAGEIAYSYSSNIFFVGSSSGNDVLPVGGKYYIEKTNSAYTIASAAFNAANSGASSSAAFDKANTAYDAAAAAYGMANTTYSNYAYPAYVAVGPAFDKANSANYLAFLASSNASAAFTQANNVGGAVTTANAIAVAAFTKANSASAAAGAGFDYANTAQAIAVAAYGNSNTKFSSSGGTINGSVSISGNLTVTGNTTFINVASYVVNDPLLYIASNNYTSDIVDIGFVGNYSNGACTTLHTGVFRDAGSKEWYVFENYSVEPENNVIDPNGNNFTISVLNATLRTSNIILAGMNTVNWITGAFDKANASYQTAGDGYNVAVAAFVQANNVGGAVTTANNTAIAAFDRANNVAGAVTTANSYAVAAFTQANNVGGAVTTANNTAIAAFTQANNVGGAVTTANLIATSAFAAANAASAQAANADFITSGTLVVARGGTGATTFTSNGVLYGSGTAALKVTAAGTEGQVLQASSTGVPTFAMLDGGSF